MNVLKRIHHWLRPDGLLLDLHPEPDQPGVGVLLGGLGRVHLGRIDNTALISNIRAARAALALVVEQQWFSQRHALVFDFISHFGSVDEWLQHRQERRATSIVDPAIIDRARELLASQPAGELLVSERVQASLFTRTNPMASRG